MNDETGLSGILLHPTSLPAKHGIGDFGPDAYQFIDLLADLKQSLWQVLPLGAVTSGYSPYQSPSAFAGNPLLISLELLQKAGWLPEKLEDVPNFCQEFVDFPQVESWKTEKLKNAFWAFQTKASEEQRSIWKIWCKAQNFWLEDYALFATMKDVSAGTPDAQGMNWSEWPVEWRFRKAEAVAVFRKKYVTQIALQKFVQWQFFQQWSALREYARQKSIQIIGDLPIFVAYDSADVWANPELFELDKNQRPAVVAGVPPDYFSASGQRWGNPLYCWDAMRENRYAWWKTRLRFLLEQFDIVRIDHFRGFESYWEIPATEATAIRGKWRPGPGLEFFEELSREFGELPIIAEDLGLITPEVEALRESCGFPGMKVLQFAFSDENNPYLPHNYQTSNTVVYSGTHDNNTTLGWFRELSETERDRLRVYLSKDVRDESVCYELLRLAWSSTAKFALAPLQDLLTLGSECRLNTPGTFAGTSGAGGKNWGWRCRTEQLEALNPHWLTQLTETYGRTRTSPLSQK